MHTQSHVFSYILTVCKCTCVKQNFPLHKLHPIPLWLKLHPGGDNFLQIRFSYVKPCIEGNKPEFSTCEKQKIEKTHSKENNYMHKTIFTWFDNLLMFTELLRFYYYQGKRNTRCGYSFSSHTKNTTTLKNPNNQIAFSTQNRPKKFSAQAFAPWTKPQ